MEDRLNEAINHIAGILQPGIDRRYFDNHLRRYLATLKLLPELPREARVLDIGAGYGHLSILIKMGYGCEVHATDHYSKRAERLTAAGINFSTCDSAKEPLPFEDDSFDAVVNGEVIEHLPAFPHGMVYEMQRVLKPGGRLVITTPNLYSLVKRLRFITGKRIIPPYSRTGDEPLNIEDLKNPESITGAVQKRLSARQEFGHTHFREYELEELRALVSEADLNIKASGYLKTHKIFSETEKGLDLNPAHCLYRLVTAACAPWRHQIYVVGEKKKAPL